MKHSPIIFVTSHPAKARQVADHLHYPVSHKNLDIDEIQSLDPIEVVTKKVKEAYRLVKKPVVVENVSISFEAMGRLPGPYFKAFLTELKLEGLCRLLDGYTTREATVEVNYAYFDGEVLKMFGARRDGHIAGKPRGEAIFGSDVIFIPHGHVKTWSEMDEEELAETSVTTIALNNMRTFLERHVPESTSVV